MPRLPLIHIPNGLYSVVSKCNNNEFLFDADEKFEMYLNHLSDCKKHFDFCLYDIVCMSNHVHELYRVPEEVTIAEILQRVKGLFARNFNKRFGRSNHFWKNKPYYRIIENERYAFATMNYFHWNPVKAGLVGRPEQWPFSGYRFHVFGERSGLMGKLLDPIDKTYRYSKKIENEVQETLLASKRRFLGSLSYKKQMRAQFGRFS